MLTTLWWTNLEVVCLLLDALIITINWIVVMESKAYPFDGNETFDIFDAEFHTLSENMQHEVMKVFKHFLEFLKTFDSHQVHNMLALILDPCFKSLQVVENFVGA